MFDLNKLKTNVRPAITLIVGAAAYAVTKDVVQNNTTEPETKLQKATLKVGTFVLATLIADKASGHFVDIISETIRTTNEATSAVKNETSSSS